MITLKKVNKEINDRWPGYELVKGEGYFYVCGPNTECWNQTGIYVYGLNHMTLEQWLESVEAMIEKNKDC